MGGASSEVRTDTRRILFEVATFDPRSVRRTARRHGMHTESSHRFERGVDPSDVARVLARAVALTTTLAGGAAARGQIHVQGARESAEMHPIARRDLRFRPSRVRALAGIEVAEAISQGILERLGCTVERSSEDVSAWRVLVPTHRPDLTREVDLVEEVIRVHGIDSVPAELPPIHASRDVGGREELGRRAKEVCATLGLSEAITYSFTSPRVLAALSAPTAAVRLDNPMNEHHSVLRTTLLVGLLDAVKNARRHGERDVRVFTVGPVFLEPKPGDALPVESLRVAFAIAGERTAWLEKPKAFDVWDAKGYAAEIARRLAGVPATIVAAPGPLAPAHLHPRGGAFLELGGARIGSFGPLHPDVVEALELDGEVLVFEMELDPFVAGAAVPKFAAIPRFPASHRDVALVVKDDIAAGEVEALVRAAAGPLAEGVRLFDRFVGGQVPTGHSSLAFRVVYRAADRTLTDAEVDAAHANVVATASAQFGATLRG
jgi:phenylalanyl-tRNA synthetase beta chain